ncbi:MAG: AI-2E family transporter [Bacteroidota bacterium]
MTDLSNVHRGTRILLIAASLVIIIWGINQAQSVLVVLLVSVFLAIIGRAPVLWMERKHIPSALAVLVVVATMVTILLSVGAVVGASLNSFSNALPFYQTRFHEMLIAARATLAEKGFVVTDEVLVGYVNPAAIMNLTAGLFTSLSSVLSNIVLILFTTTFILFEASGFPAKLRMAHDAPHSSFPQFKKFINDMNRYVVIKTLLNLIAGIATAVWLSILGVDFPVLWGFLTFLLHYIPSVGSIVAAVPAVLLALVQSGGGSAVLTASGYLVIGTVLGNVVEPRIMGRKFDMSTLIVFLSLIFWGNLLGLIGAILCVPLTMTLKLACETNEDTRWIAVLLGREMSPEGSPVASKKRK